MVLGTRVPREQVILLIVLACLSIASAEGPGIKKTAIRTPIPALYDKWKAATVGQGTDQEARKKAEEYRSVVCKDPFTKLVEMSCAERKENKESVVWENSTAMVVVPTGKQVIKLLVVPKRIAMFLFDLDHEARAGLSQVAAATCDALVAAGGALASSLGDSCDIYVHSPAELSVRQLHVHVKLKSATAGAMDDAFLHRTATHMRALIDGGGCF